MLSPARPHEPVPAGADVQPAGRQHPQPRVDGVFDDCQDIVKAVSNDLAFKRQLPHRHRQLDQLGAAAGAGGVLLRRLLPGHDASNDAEGQLRRAVGQLRQRLRRPRRAHDGPADRPAGAWPPTRTTCSTSSSAPAPTACAAAAETYETSSPSMDISKASQLRALRVRPAGPRRRDACASCSATELARDGGFDAGRRTSRRASRASASSPAAARMPTALATIRDTCERYGVDDRHPHGRRPEGGARAPASPACR